MKLGLNHSFNNHFTSDDRYLHSYTAFLISLMLYNQIFFQKQGHF